MGDRRKHGSRPRRQSWPGLLALLLHGTAGHAEPALQTLSLGSFVDAISLEQLADMVVTDAKVAQSPDSVTQNILVLKAEDLERQPVDHRHLAEWMRHTSGQFVNVLSRNVANWGSYAGLEPKYNTWLLDGLPIDSFVEPMSLDPSIVERVEIHKGPASVLYSNYLSMDFEGNETPLAGTTNLVLKNRVETPLTRISAGIGSWGTRQGRLWHQGRQGALSYFAGASGEQADYVQYGDSNTGWRTTEDPDYRKTRLFGNLSYEIDRPSHTVSLFLHQTRHDGDEGRPNRDFQHRYDTLNLTYNNQFTPQWHVQFKLGERRYNREFDNDNFSASAPVPDLSLNNHETIQQTIRPMDLTFSHLHSDSNLLTLGLDRQRVDYQTRRQPAGGAERVENDASAVSTGLFIQEKMQFGDWVARLGLRHNRIEHEYSLLGGNIPAATSAAWNRTLWSAGLRHNPRPGLAWFANIGTSFLPPSAKQLGGTIPAGSTEPGHLANPALTPEDGLGRDIGLEWRADPGFELSLRLFHNSIDNAIVSNATLSSAGNSQAQSFNAGTAEAKGVELEARHTPSDNLSWFANVTHADTRVENPGNPDQDGAEIRFVPSLTVNLGLELSLPVQWRISPYFHWIGRYYESTFRSERHAFGHYGLVNLRARKNLGKDLELVLDLNNLTDRRYAMPWGFRDPGFHGCVSLNFTL